MYSKELAVVIPVFNEEETIKEMVEDLCGLIGNEKINFTLFLINDGSTDNTSAILNQLQENNTHISVHTKKNSGHGPTIYYGYQLAAKYEWIFQTDSDYQYDLQNFLSLWQIRNEYDILLGERKFKHASTARNIISSITSNSVKLVFGKTVNDVNVPFRLMRSSVLNTSLKIINPLSFAPNVLLTALFLKHKYRIFVFAISARSGAKGRKSKAGKNILLGSFQSFIELLKLRGKL